VESLQSHIILVMSHWSSGLPVCFPPQGTQVQIPWGDLCKTGILLLALSCYIGDPDVIRSLASSLSRCFTRLHADNVQTEINLITLLSCPGFTLAAGFPSGFTTDGRALWRACNLTWFSPCLTGPVDYLFASRHKGHRFKSPGGTYVKLGFSC
jgi:hypothetical protein